MAVEDSVARDRENWAGMARYWYHKAADKNPNFGRIQHHLAVLAYPDMLQQLFYCTKCLVSVDPFPPAGERIKLLLHRVLKEPKPDQLVVASAFVTAHGKLFTQRPLSDFNTLMNEYLFHLDGYISGRGSEFKMCGVFIASCNFAAIFQYGSTDAVLPNEFKESLVQDETGLTASKNWTPVDNLDTIEAEFCEYQNSQSHNVWGNVGRCANIVKCRLLRKSHELVTLCGANVYLIIDNPRATLTYNSVEEGRQWPPPDELLEHQYPHLQRILCSNMNYTRADADKEEFQRICAYFTY